MAQGAHHGFHLIKVEAGVIDGNGDIRQPRRVRRCFDVRARRLIQALTIGPVVDDHGKSARFGLGHIGEVDLRTGPDGIR